MGRTKEQIEQDWWDAWWEADYSWEGLKKHPWVGFYVTTWGKVVADEPDDTNDLARPANLQDYWRVIDLPGRDWPRGVNIRTDAEMVDELIELEGEPAFHIMHCPKDYLCRLSQDKIRSLTDRKGACIKLRIGIASVPTFKGDFPNIILDGVDRRAQFKGVILNNLSHGMTSINVSNISFIQACFCEKFELTEKPISNYTFFTNVLFFEKFEISHLEIRSDVSFYRSVFIKYIVIKNTSTLDRLFDFSECIVFGFFHANEQVVSGFLVNGATFYQNVIMDSLIFVRSAEFKRSIFFGDFEIANCKFQCGCLLESNNFLGLVNGINTEFVMQFISLDCKFNGVFRLSGSRFRSVFVRGIIFENDIELSECTFREGVVIKNIFSKGVFSCTESGFFGNTSIEGCRFLGNVSFYQSVFKSHFSCCFNDFERSVDFESIVCDGEFKFINNEKILKEASFNKMIVKGVADFSNVNFCGKMDFSFTNFEKIVYFEMIKFPDDPLLCQGAFKLSRFIGHASFIGAGCRSFASFSGAIFEQGISIDLEPEAKVSEQFKSERDSVVNRLSGYWPDRAHHALVLLEGGCRVLKQAMRSASNPIREQVFYRLELMARASQPDLRSGERSFLYIYEIISDYGSSFIRPAVSLFAVFMICFYIYYALISLNLHDFTEWMDISYLLQSFSFSLSRIFPFGAFQEITDEYIKSAAGDSLFRRVIVALLASVQSSVALVLSFLFGLALRRRFQIG